MEKERTIREGHEKGRAPAEICAQVVYLGPSGQATWNRCDTFTSRIRLLSSHTSSTLTGHHSFVLGQFQHVYISVFGEQCSAFMSTAPRFSSIAAVPSFAPNFTFSRRSIARRALTCRSPPPGIFSSHQHLTSQIPVLVVKKGAFPPCNRRGYKVHLHRNRTNVRRRWSLSQVRWGILDGRPFATAWCTVHR